MPDGLTAGATTVLVSKPDGLDRILLLDVRLDIDGGVNDELHRRLRDARTASKVTS